MRTRCATVATSLVLSSLAALAPAAAEVPGDLDRTFSYLRPAIATPTADETVPALGVQSDHKVVHVLRSAGPVQIRRTLPTGAPDLSWGPDGSVTVTSAAVVQVLADDRVLLAGADDAEHAFVMRLTRDGRPDPSFGEAGMVALPLESGYTAAEATTVVPLPGGGLVVAGQALFGGGVDTDPFVHVLGADGSLAPGFRPGDGTMFPTDGTGTDTDRVVGVVTDRAGGYWAVGSSGTEAGGFHLEAWHFVPTAGTSDSMLLQPAGATATAAATGPEPGSLFLTGADAAGGYVTRLLGGPSAIAPDPAWGSGGLSRATQQVTSLALAAQADGRLLVLGHAGGRDVLTRLTSAGALDSGFTSAGSVVLPGDTAAARAPAMSLAVGPDSRVVVGTPAAGTPARGRIVRVLGNLAHTSVTATATRAVGLQQTATVTFRNDGPDPTGPSRVEVALTGALTGSLTTTAGACAGTAPRWSCDVGSLASGQLVTLTARLSSALATTGTLTATGRGTTYDDDGADQTATVRIATTAPAPATFTLDRRPRIVGKATVGSRLRARPGSWSPDPRTIRYRWLRNGKAIKKAGRATYLVKRVDRGKRISVRVSVRRPGLAPASAVSRAKRIRR